MKSRRVVSLFASAAILIAAGCAQRTPPTVEPQPAAQVVPQIDSSAIRRGNELVREGCYDCLNDARQVFTRLASGGGAARGETVARLFEVELLMALREKELALDATTSLARARALARELPPAFEADRIIRMVDAVLPDPVGIPNAATKQLRVANADYVAAAGKELVWLQTSPASPEFRDYLSFAFDCSYPSRNAVPADGARPISKLDQIYVTASPLIQYRVGVCRLFAAPLPLPVLQLSEPGAPSELLLARTNVARFVETSFFRALPEMRKAEEDGGEDAHEYLLEAYRRFRQSPSITYALGELNLILGDCDAALRYFDETIALSLDHELAMLGRANCLTQQRRTAEAIANTTRMIQLRTYNVQQAFYYRAVNHHRAGNLAQARSDIELAKESPAMGERAQAEVLTLAGIIEHDQDALDEAERDLRRARASFGGDFNCSAAWYLGRVFVKREGWDTATSFFETAMKCYDHIANQTELRISQLKLRTNIEPNYKARRIAALEASLPDTRSQYHASAFNAANYALRAGDRTRAREFVEIAAKDPALAEPVARLREALK